ncbi:hypothetical protein AALA69_03340 [Eggerthellaceae bacterium 24-137]
MIYNENLEPVEDPDLDNGEIVSTIVMVEGLWVIDAPEVTELRVKRRYENGGVIAEEVVVSPAEGHWEAPEFAQEWLKSNGDRNERYHSVPIELYREFTSYEKGESEKAKFFEEQLAKIPGEFQNDIDELHGYIDSVDEVVCSLYEAALSNQQIIDQQDEALCALYEAQLGA